LIGTVIVPLGMFLLIGFVFGGAKPVSINFRQLRHPHRDMGPVANLLMIIFWAFIAQIGGLTNEAFGLSIFYQEILNEVIKRTITNKSSFLIDDTP